MNCLEFEAELNELMDQRQPLRLSAAASEHCLDCPECQALTEGFQSLFSCLPAEKVSLPEPTSQRTAQPQPRKHFESSLRSNASLFSKPRRTAAKAAAATLLLGANSAAGSGLTVTDAAGKSIGPDQIPVAVPETVTPSAPWSLKVAFLALIPTAAAVYFLGIGLFSQFTNPSSNPSDAPTQPLYAVAETGQTSNEDNPKSEFNWERTINRFDASWRSIAMHRAGACQIPGVQPYFYSVNGAVEALRTNFVPRKAPAIAPSQEQSVQEQSVQEQSVQEQDAQGFEAKSGNGKEIESQMQQVEPQNSAALKDDADVGSRD